MSQPKPQLQPGHWYLVLDDTGRASVRAFMADCGWFPSHPEPHAMICEMSRVIHPDNVIIGNDFTLTEWDRIVITNKCPAVADQPQAVRTIRALAERLSIAAGYQWTTDWMGDPAQAPRPDQGRHMDYLGIASDLFHQAGGDQPAIRDWDDAREGRPADGIFQPRRWPTEIQPGAIPLLNG